LPEKQTSAFVPPNNLAGRSTVWSYWKNHGFSSPRIFKKRVPIL